MDESRSGMDFPKHDHGWTDTHQENFEESSGVYGVMQDLVEQERKKAQKEIQKANKKAKDTEEERDKYKEESTIDELTGLYNRRGLNQRLKEIDPERHPYLFFYFDLDNFKKINDTLGHNAGDEMLLAFVEFAGINFRPEDPKTRLGGDEFLAVVENSDEIFDLDQKISERIFSNLEKFNQERLMEGLPILEFSLGISVADKNNPSIENAIKRADSAMYRDKNQRKSQH